MSEPNLEELVPSREPGPRGTGCGEGETRTLGTLARLLVGGALLGRDAVGSAAASTIDASKEAGNVVPDDEVPSGRLVDATASVPSPTPSPRHLFIGALFESVERIEHRGGTVLRLVAKTTSPAVGWARRSRLAAPARHRFDLLVTHGEDRVRRWVERGVIEEQRSRALLNATVSRTVNTSLDRVVDSPQVQGLVEEFVQAQGQSMGRRFLDELRALAVSGDQVVTRIARRVLRHPKHKVPPFPRTVPAPLSHPSPPTGLRGRMAGFVSRLLAFMIDVVFISICVRATGWILEDIRIVTGTYFYLPALTTIGDWTSPIAVTLVGGLLMSAAYFVFFWTVAGVTPGKAVMGLCVVTRDGRRLSLVRSLVRLVGYTVSTLLYGLGYLWIAIDNQREGWHDKIARTAVVYAWDAHPSDRSLANRVPNLPSSHPDEPGIHPPQERDVT